MLTLTPPSASNPAAIPFAPRPTMERSPFVFVGERLWLDFVNSEFGIRRFDALRDFESMVRWLEAAALLDDAAFDADAELGARLITRGFRSGDGAANRFVVADRLIAHRRRDAESDDFSARARRGEHRANGGDLHRIVRTDDDTLDSL